METETEVGMGMGPERKPSGNKQEGKENRTGTKPAQEIEVGMEWKRK